MLDDMRVNDEMLNVGDIRQLENADELAHFFARLRYDVDQRINIPNYGVLGMGSADMRQHIHKIELIGKDPIDRDISIYLFEVCSVTAKLRNDIARRFRERPENAILVLTKDYEELEFVLLDRLVSRSQSRRVALKQAIRPIPLTVDRLHPKPVALRLLKRFTFTKEDAAYQWEKLRAAYMLAEWSEEYFNNRALFSDYYLRERLTDQKITPEWDEDVRPLGREIYKYLITARKKYTRQPEDVIQKELYEPVFKLLGFDFAKQKAGASAVATADYLLYSPNDRSKPIAAALTYVWNRNLDDVDESRERTADDGGKPFEIPGAKVVSLLEKQAVPWVLVTNGKLWRLYSSTASNKATNYYEIDLEEAIAASDQITALKYWWLMFRREAFTGFLDKLLKHSAEYAKELGNRLKDRVFVEIFPQFAKGFIAEMRVNGINDLDDAVLATVFSGTMTFLYRLMFTLYAESLELLPLNDERGYGEQSLNRMKHEIADAGGTLLDTSPERLSAWYQTASTRLYDRLQALFDVIDRGSDELNMPTYDGGLFSPETDSGQFLVTYAIPDRYLALGLDRLTRDVDDHTKALVFIDFKSLGVRHLGSIYEGLLEFRLRIAGEKLAVTKEKGKEVYKPVGQVKKPLAIIDRGEVYLENDKRERKATGSYYTPDYIVKDIVRHTVGPVLDRKFEALETRLHEAQRGYRNYVKLVEARQKAFGRDESAAVYWNNWEMQNLVDDCLNVRVLDPAMGSGHFLVEAVDYVSNRLIDFLNAWSDNPVWAFLEKTRDDILNEMERQKVTIDADRLTRVSLLKRAVLKRCVYGVDLNAMAVELAKVSLWLDAFTLGAPLSFLDHHLKHGNSLIGARITDVQDYLRGGEGPEQIDMFSGSEFAGVMLATDLMRQVSYLSDNTIEQTRQSAQAYHDARGHLAPYKRLLDVYTSRWFSNSRYATKKTASLRLFLKDSQTRAWLRAPQTTLDDTSYPTTDIAANALQAAEEKRFFHWELEFPEVFFAPSRTGGQDVQLSPNGGFDAVVANPPYSDIKGLEEIFIRYLFNAYEFMEFRVNIFAAFIERSLHSILSPNGSLGFIIPTAFLTQVSYAAIRKQILQHYWLKEIIRLPNEIFGDSSGEVKVDTCLIIIDKDRDRPNSATSVLIYEGFIRNEVIGADTAIQDFVVEQNNWIGQEETAFTLVHPKESALLRKIEAFSSHLEEYCEFCLGITPYDKYRGHTSEQIKNKIFHANARLNDTYKKLLVSGDVYRYSVTWNSEEWIRYGNWLAAPREQRFFTEDRLLIQQIIDWSSLRILVGWTDEELYNTQNQFNLLACDGTNLKYILAILNSTTITYYHRRTFLDVSLQRFQKVLIKDAKRFPIRRISFTTPAGDRERLTQEAIGTYDIGDDAGVLQSVQVQIDSNKADGVHDLLAHLSQRMIDLNKQKHGENKRFLDSLEKRLQIWPDKSGATGVGSLTGKTILQGYPGDYQKGEAELPWREFYYRLYQNRNRFAVSLSDVEGEIQGEYEKSLATLLPIKRELARTDALIDKIVYRLYGLTGEQIELIERPQYERALADAKAQVVID